IPNILTLRNLAKNLEREKEERRKELNIMNPSDHKILMQEFLQVAHLSPSTKHDESARRLLEMEKVIKYKVEEISRKIYVKVESETTPGFHLRAAALYINKLRKQEPNKHLPKMIFLTYQEAQNIYHSQYDDKSEVLVGSENEDDISNKSDEDTDNESNDHNINDNSRITTSSKEIFNHIEHILGINSSLVMSPSNVPVLNEPRSNKINIDTLNITAIYKQEFKEFLESILRNLQTLQENSLFLQNLIKSKNPSIKEQYNESDQYTLLTHLLSLVTSNSFKEMQNLVNIIYKDMNPHRHTTSNANILPLEQETKQKWKVSYKS
ncbi:25984_t:CDS:2, partial [Racocetra persica]